MKSAATELQEIAARQVGVLVEWLFAGLVGLSLYWLAPGAEVGAHEVQTVFLSVVAGAAGAFVMLVHRFLVLLAVECPRCREPFYRFPFRLPVFLPRSCAHCAQSLSEVANSSDASAA